MSRHESSGTVVMRIDGGARGNPGPAAYAVVVEGADGAQFDTFSKSLGETTNNVAEYEGFVAALDYALRRNHSRVKVISDSELLVRQVQGRYKVKSPDLQPLFEKAREMIRRFEAFSIEHVRREQNREADRLVNQTLDASDGRRAHQTKRASPALPLKTTATYRAGGLKLANPLPLGDGEEVEIEIHRKA